MRVTPEQRVQNWTPEPRVLAQTLVRDALRLGMDAGVFPGAQVYASVNGDVLIDVGIGEARLGTPMTPEAMVSWQCNTKPVTAVAVCQQWERGSLGLDDPVVRYLPDWGTHGKAPITIRNILNHTARFDPPMGTGLWEAAPDEVEALVCGVKLADGWPLGTRTSYSPQLGYVVLSEIVRKVDGRPFNRYVREEIFEPLHMNDCWVGVDPDQLDSVSERMAFLYDTAGAKPEPPLLLAAQARGLDKCLAGTGAIGPTRELGRFYEAMLACLAGEPGALLKADTVRAMTRNADLGEGRLGHFGMGFQVVSGYYGKWFPRAFGHEGLRFAIALADPDSGVVIAATINGLPRNGTLKELAAVSRAIYDALNPD